MSEREWQDRCDRAHEWWQEERDRRVQAEADLAATQQDLAIPTLIPVGEHPEPGTRGLLPVVANGEGEWCYDDAFTFICDVESEVGRTILADPRPGGAHE